MPALYEGPRERGRTLARLVPPTREGTTVTVTHPLLDLAPLTAAHFASIERRVAALLSTEQDVVITQGEALLPLEGCIRAGRGPVRPR